MLSIFVVAAWLMALFNGLYIAPRAQAALGHLEDRLKGSQVSFEIQPRVFYEGFPKIVLYVQDVKSAQGAAMWKGVFMADLSDAANPKITLAKEGIVVSEGPDRLHLHLIDGSEHETDSQRREPLPDLHFPADRHPARPCPLPRISPTSRSPPR